MFDERVCNWLNFFDLHCDTIYECYENDFSLRKNSLMIDKAKVERYDKYVQVFALFCGTQSRNKNSLFELKPQDRLEALIKTAKTEFIKNNDWILQCYNSNDLDLALLQGKAAAFLSLEGAELLTSDEHIEIAYNAGIRIINLSWNYKNKYACGALYNDNEGLSNEGKKLVNKLVEKNIIIDISHLSNKGYLDLCSQTDAPFIASHSNSRQVYNHLRNLTNVVFGEIIKRGGLCGINLYNKFLSKKENPSFKEVLEHIEHFCSIGGEKHLSLGCDFDGCNLLPKGIKTADDIYKLAEYMLKHNYSQTIVDGLFYDNAYRFFKKVL